MSDIGVKLGVEGESEFKNALKEINTNLKTLGTEMKAVTSAFDRNDTSIENLSEQNKVLNKQIDEQKDKLGLLKARLAESAAEYGENDARTQKWQQQVNLATAALNKSELQLKNNNKALEEASKESKSAGDETEKAGKSAKKSGDDAEKGESGWSKLGKGLTNVGKVAGQAVAALGAAAAGAGAAIGAMTVKAAYGADDINTLAKQTGLSVEEIQKFQYASEQIDVPLETLTGSMAKLTRNMAAAKEGTGETSEIFSKLGYDITELGYGVYTIEELEKVYKDLVKAATRGDGEMRFAAQDALESLGISFLDLQQKDPNKLFDKFVDGAEKAAKATNLQADAFFALGVEITNADGTLRNNQDVFSEAIAALGKMENGTERDAIAMQIFGKSAQQLNPLILGGADALKQLGDEAEAAGLILSQDSLDTLNLLSDAMDTFKASVKGSGSLFATAFAGPMAEGLNTITGYIHELTTAFNEGGFDALADKAGEVLSSVINKITESLPRVIQLGTSVILKIVEGITQNIPALAAGATTIMTQLTSTLIEMLPLLIGAAMQIITTLALGIAESLPELIPAVIDTMLTIIDTLIDNVDLLVDASIAIIMALAEGLIDALPILVEKIPVIIAKLVEAIVKNFPKLMEMGLLLLVELAKGLIVAIPDLLRAIPEIIVAIVKGFGSAMGSIINIGKDIVKGLWEGIKAMGTWIKDKVSGFFSGIVDGVKGLLGIESPSKVFAGIGENMAAGLGKGFGAEMQGVAKQINDSIPTSINSQINATAKMGEGIVNGMAAIMGSQGGVYNINLMLPDGTSLANIIFDPLKGVIKQRGVALA